jgi:hypothetical protein
METQALRYSSRGTHYLDSKDCEEYSAVLVAPERYLQKGFEFTASISYEVLRDWFKKENDQRSLYKAALLSIAIEKQRRGYNAIPDEFVTSWQHQYYQLAMELFPELHMRKPPDKIPAGSGFLYFHAPEIKNRRAVIVHKTGKKKF